MKKYLRFLASLIILLSPLAVFGQTNDLVETKTLVLHKIIIQINGPTSEWVLREKMGLKEGRVFKSLPDFEDYLADLRQKLSNQRTIKTFTVSYEIKEEAPQDILLTVAIRDGWNLVALPYFNYNTNEGLNTSLRGRDFNFLGSLEPLKINLDYRFNENQKSSFLVDTEFAIPFYFSGLSWQWNFFQAADFRMENPWGWQMDNELKVTWPLVPGIDGSLKLTEGLRINALEDNDKVEHTIKNILGLSYGTDFLLSENFYGWKPVDYNIEVFVNGVASPDAQEKVFLEAATGLRHGLKAGRIDWSGNLRSGETFTLSQVFSYGILDQLWTQELIGEIQYHIPFHFDWWSFGGSLRAGGWYQAGKENKGAGSFLRGIVDKRITSWRGLYLNLEAPVTILEWKPTQWWGVNWAKVTEFEMMASPILDIGLADVYGDGLGTEDLWTGGGLEVLVFSDFIKSFFLRASLAYDLQAVFANKSLSEPSPRDGGEIREISIGLGYFY